MILLNRRYSGEVPRRGYSGLDYVEYYGQDVSVLDRRLQTLISYMKRTGSGANCLVMVQFPAENRNARPIVVTPYHTHRYINGQQRSSASERPTVYIGPANNPTSTVWGLSGSTLAIYMAGASVDTTSEKGLLLYGGRYGLGLGGAGDAATTGNRLLGLIEAQSWIDNNLTLGVGFKHFQLWPIYGTTYIQSAGTTSAFGLSPGQQASSMDYHLTFNYSRYLSAGVRMSYAAIFYCIDQTGTDNLHNLAQSTINSLIPATSSAGTGHPNLQAMVKRRVYFIPDAVAAAVATSFARARAIRAQQHLLIR